MSPTADQLLIFGCGFLGLRAARLWLAEGGTVMAVTRNPAKAAQLQSLGIEPVLADLMQPETLASLLRSTHVLYCVGFDRTSSWSKESLYLEGLTHVINAVAKDVQRFVYVSSSSVYHQDDGSWVDETSHTEPTSEGGRICLAAEQRLRSRVEQATILRMSGLYGPERLLARVDQLQANEPIGGNPEAWLNLIHGDDAARACVAALKAAKPSPLYLVSDDRPHLRREYFTELAQQVGAPPPVFSGASSSRHTADGLNKRCRNNKIKSELQLEWVYPDISRGLQPLTDRPDR
ncbi:MAG: SDR family oxidoreductase [Planctomycetota bacterium]|nr:MAG: SDR family oxidoreductase [Planctomycetota bacterium]